MAFVATDKDGAEAIYMDCPTRNSEDWNPTKFLNGDDTHWMYLPKGSIRKLIGRELTWEDEPVEVESEREITRHNAEIIKKFPRLAETHYIVSKDFVHAFYANCLELRKKFEDAAAEIVNGGKADAATHFANMFGHMLAMETIFGKSEFETLNKLNDETY